MKILASPMSIRPKGKGKDVFDSIMDSSYDNKPKSSKKRKNRKTKKQKPWQKDTEDK